MSIPEMTIEQTFAHLRHLVANQDALVSELRRQLRDARLELILARRREPTGSGCPDCGASRPHDNAHFCGRCFEGLERVER